MTCLIGLGRPRIGDITRQIGTSTCRIGDGKLTLRRNSLKSQFLMMVSPYPLMSLSCPQFYHHLRTQSEVIHLYLSMPRSRVNTEYSIHRVQHTPCTAYTEYCIHHVINPRSTVSRSLPVSHLSADHVVLNSLHSHNYKLTNE